METELAAAVAQFGVAGLIGWMWLTERRASAGRDKQLNEAHDRILRDGAALEALLKALENNTRALTALQGAHQRLTDLLFPRRRARIDTAEPFDPADDMADERARDGARGRAEGAKPTGGIDR